MRPLRRWRRRRRRRPLEWAITQLPSLAASFRLALEVLDTHGPDGVRIEDPLEAEVWNNRYFVWREQFTPPPS